MEFDFRSLALTIVLVFYLSALGSADEPIEAYVYKGHPVVRSIYGPTEISRGLSADTLLTFGVKVDGGSPPYTYLWHGDPGKIICKGTECAEIRVSTTQTEKQRGRALGLGHSHGFFRQRGNLA